jgi:hypothetical protein
MTKIVAAIVEAKRKAGKGAYLLLWADGRCFLFDGTTNTIGRWDLAIVDHDQLIQTGIVDCQGKEYAG